MWKWLMVTLLVLLCGCNLAFILKSDIHNTHENFKTFRANVEAIDEPEKVQELGDEIENWFKKWKGKDDDKNSG